MNILIKRLFTALATWAVVAGCSAAAPGPEESTAADPGANAEDFADSVEEALSCPAGTKMVCDPGCEEPPCTKPRCWCEAIPPTPVSGVLIPKFYVTHVVYSVP